LTTLKNCITNNSGQANFDLTRADQIIKNGISNLGLVSYFESLDTTTNTLSNPIANPSNILIYQIQTQKSLWEIDY
jgi:hypothetical protein